jgi:hypothetical protein
LQNRHELPDISVKQYFRNMNGYLDAPPWLRRTKLLTNWLFQQKWEARATCLSQNLVCCDQTISASLAENETPPGRLGWERRDGIAEVHLLPTKRNTMLFAYIDTALGSMLLQGMAGMILAGMIMGRRILAVPLAWFQSRGATPESEGELQEVSDASANR